MGSIWQGIIPAGLSPSPIPAAALFPLQIILLCARTAACEYVNRYSIRELMQGLLEALALQQPDDPRAFLMDELARLQHPDTG